MNDHDDFGTLMVAAIFVVKSIMAEITDMVGMVVIPDGTLMEVMCHI